MHNKAIKAIQDHRKIGVKQKNTNGIHTSLYKT